MTKNSSKPSLSINQPSEKLENSGAIPIAKVTGGKHDKCLLYLHPDGKKTNKDTIKMNNEINPKIYDKEMKALKLRPIERTKLINKLEEAKNKKIPLDHLNENEDIKAIYEKILKQDEDLNNTEFQLDDNCSFELVPSTDPKKRQVYYIAGQSGSGKSYIAKGLGEKYKKLYPEREVYLISKLNEDETLDSMKPSPPKRISIDSLVADYPKLDEFSNCMIIFDDFDTLTKDQLKAVEQLISDLAIQGRHTNTTMLILTHYLTNYKKTRLILNEVTNVVVYPMSTAFTPLKYLLMHYFGLEKEDVHQLKKLGRWVSISKSYPQYLISQHFAKLLNQ